MEFPSRDTFKAPRDWQSTSSLLWTQPNLCFRLVNLCMCMYIITMLCRLTRKQKICIMVWLSLWCDCVSCCGNCLCNWGVTVCVIDCSVWNGLWCGCLYNWLVAWLCNWLWCECQCNCLWYFWPCVTDSGSFDCPCNWLWCDCITMVYLCNWMWFAWPAL